MDHRLRKSLDTVAGFYDRRKVGDVGPLGFRRSSDMATLLACVDRLLAAGLITPGETAFLDLGCGDGRVNLFFSFLTRLSVGIECDEWTLEEYPDARNKLKTRLSRAGLIPPPQNVFLFHGDSLDDATHGDILHKTGTGLDQFDLFYTYLVMHEEFAGLLRKKAKKDAVFMVYGLQKIMPDYEGFERLEPLSPLQGILALYRKI
ncbi:MAG: hypothetical protein ACQEQ7_00455 [Thermodesulfobacteriota bacterium]